MLPTKFQQQAIEAKLNFMLGAEEYDRLFLGFVCGSLSDNIANLFVETEDRASAIEAEYSWHVAVIIESVLKMPVKSVNVLPKNLSNSQMR
jgi:hypothetical protein